MLFTVDSNSLMLACR